MIIDTVALLKYKAVALYNKSTVQYHENPTVLFFTNTASQLNENYSYSIAEQKYI